MSSWTYQLLTVVTFILAIDLHADGHRMIAAGLFGLMWAFVFNAIRGIKE